jgi:hypothetical protein
MRSQKRSILRSPNRTKICTGVLNVNDYAFDASGGYHSDQVLSKSDHEAPAVQALGVNTLNQPPLESKTACHLAPKPLSGAASHPIQLGRIKNKIPEGVTMSNLENALKELREKRNRAQVEIDTLDQLISGIESLNGGRDSRNASQTTRFVSAASRRKMAQAQKARWAKAKGDIVKPKRTISAAGRKRIAAAQRARWAKLRAGKKAA